MKKETPATQKNPRYQKNAKKTFLTSPSKKKK